MAICNVDGIDYDNFYAAALAVRDGSILTLFEDIKCDRTVRFPTGNFMMSGVPFYDCDLDRYRNPRITFVETQNDEVYDNNSILLYTDDTKSDPNKYQAITEERKIFFYGYGAYDLAPDESNKTNWMSQYYTNWIDSAESRKNSTTFINIDFIWDVDNYNTNGQIIMPRHKNNLGLSHGGKFKLVNCNFYGGVVSYASQIEAKYCYFGFGPKSKQGYGHYAFWDDGQYTVDGAPAKKLVFERCVFDNFWPNEEELAGETDKALNCIKFETSNSSVPCQVVFNNCIVNNDKTKRTEDHACIYAVGSSVKVDVIGTTLNGNIQKPTGSNQIFEEESGAKITVKGGTKTNQSVIDFVDDSKIVERNPIQNVYQYGIPSQG